MNLKISRTRKLKSLCTFLTWLPAALLAGALPAALAESAKSERPIGEWLLAGPAALPLPAFHDEDEHRKATFETLSSLPKIQVKDLWPQEAATLDWPGSAPLRWERVEAGSEGLELSAARSDVPQIAFLCAFVEADRFQKAELEVESGHLVRIFVDGELKAAKSAAEGVRRQDGLQEGSSPAPGKITADFHLAAGKHLIVVETLRHPTSELPWTVRAVLRSESENAEADNASLRATTSPEHGIRIADLLDPEAVSDLHLSESGRYLALRLRQPEVPAEDQEQWLEILNADDGARVFSVRGGDAVTAFAWAPDDRHFSYSTRQGKKSTLWLGDLQSGSVRPLLEDLENLGSHRWSPDGRSLFFAQGDEEKKDETVEAGLKRLRAPEDRWADWRTISYLSQVSVQSGAVRRLTAGALSTELQDVRSDGSRLLFSRMVYDPSERPYSRGDVFELDLDSLEAGKLASVVWFTAAAYSPEGERVLILGGASAFEGAGINVPAEMIPNEYDTQAYILNASSGSVQAISREFDPAIEQALWSRHDGRLYLRAQQGSYVRLFRYDVERQEFELLESDLEAIVSFSLAAQGPRLAYMGSGVAQAPRVAVLNTDSGQSSVAAFPQQERFERIRLGRVEAWDFTSSSGDSIQGRVHYPVDFDPERRYPAIVFYYGGTVPVSRGFGGRYPFQLWTAHGYVVYVMQPSGATGYGQAFSARHVNDWGKTTAGEIIEGTEQFLAAHDFVDPERVGCIGASYGGFMTQVLVTETDRFAACVSHAGISSLSSYWGEGWWGYLYSSVATAGSYPWNRTDLYVEQSPLFRADRIRTPLLLLHGTADTNVPPGESDQLYVALTLLGRPVEYVRVEGEDHWILRYPKRVRWMETILAWFDRHLKGQPEWWNHLYPK